MRGFQEHQTQRRRPSCLALGRSTQLAPRHHQLTRSGVRSSTAPLHCHARQISRYESLVRTLKEVGYLSPEGKVTNANLRDLAGLEPLEASAQLRGLRDHGLLELRGAAAVAQWVLAGTAAGQETRELVAKTQELEPKTQELAAKTQELPESLLREVRALGERPSAKDLRLLGWEVGYAVQRSVPCPDVKIWLRYRPPAQT
jgi:outer membrane murein-binding lipoprotein Lpp